MQTQKQKPTPKQHQQMKDEAQYLHGFLLEWLPRLTGQGFEGVDEAVGLSLPLAVQQTPMASAMYEALAHRPPAPWPALGAGGSSLSLVDPPSLARRLLVRRRDAAEALARRLDEDVEAALTEVRKTSLEEQLSAAP